MKQALPLALFLCASVVGNNAFASNVQYWLPKIGGVSFDQSPERDKPLYTLGLLYGLGLSSTFAVEAEGNYGIYGGSYRTDLLKGEFSAWSLGGFFVYRKPFSDTRYLKLKSGAMFQHVENLNQITQYVQKIDETDLVVGIGAGRIMRNGMSLEFEYTRTWNSSHNLALAVYFPFGK